MSCHLLGNYWMVLQWRYHLVSVVYFLELFSGLFVSVEDLLGTLGKDEMVLQ